jgi:hypothetical protein
MESDALLEIGEWKSGADLFRSVSTERMYGRGFVFDGR